MKLGDLGKKFTTAIFEEDSSTPSQKPTSQAMDQAKVINPQFVSVPTTPVNFQTAMPTNPFSIPAAVQVDEGLYKTILDKTNFDNTEVGKAVHRYYDVLPDVLDINTKFRTALAQAKALDGITPDRVLSTFDSLKTALQSEVDSFGKMVEQKSQAEITDKQSQINDLAQKIQQMQQTIAQLTTEVTASQSSITGAQNAFQLVVQKRSTEIDQQKAQISALL